MRPTLPQLVDPIAYGLSVKVLATSNFFAEKPPASASSQGFETHTIQGKVLDAFHVGDHLCNDITH